MKRSKPWPMFILLSLAVAAAIQGLSLARRSSLFIVRVVEVVGQPADAPLSSQEIIELAQVPTSKTSLFDLKLKEIENRLMTNSWVRSVILTARLPQTLSIQVVYRKPVALLQGSQGALKYVDFDGTLFGPVTLRGQSDLPLIHGIPQGSAGERVLSQGLALIQAWAGYSWQTVNQVSQLNWDEDSGYTLWIAFEPSYRLAVVFGSDFDRESASQSFARIDQVLQHGVAKSIPMRQIFADAYKKIVVRTARGS